MKLIIYGASGFGQEILDLANLINNHKNVFEEIIIVDDLYADTDDEKKIFSSEFVLKHIDPNNAKIVIAVGEPKIREKYKNIFTRKGFKLYSIIHPDTEIGSNSIIEDGVIIQKGVVITSNVRICKNVCIQYNTTIAHNSYIGEDSFIASGCIISGNVQIGQCTYVAIGVPIRQGVKIGNNSVVGMGSCVSRDIPSNSITIGNPLKILKNMEGYNVFK